ncbi:glycoside hydrolase superfamily [Mrakia frigida]|uniref:beta-glucosidase n=1 Tax=Mrakia frigida TaxID=29902 RepID=UPI003FCC0228
MLFFNQSLLLFLGLSSSALASDAPDGPAEDPRLAHPEEGVYTGPLADGGNWKHAFDKASSLLAQMTLPEKIIFATGHKGPCEGNIPGIERLGIPRFCIQDGPTGLRFEGFVSQFPTAHTVAATWDRDLMEERGKGMGREFRGRGVHTHLGPVTGGPLGRSPLGGRNWEGFSPDPFLSSVASYITVKAIQDQGVITSLKHFIGYEQETFRTARWRINGTVQTFRQISSDIDDKTLHETYLPSFAEAVRAGSGSVMCSYNSINGTHACENDQLLNTILKKELAFQGFVLSDWDATWSNMSSALNGLDQTMPGQGFSIGGDFGATLVDLVNEGAVPIERIDDMVLRVLTPFFHLGQDKHFPDSPTNEPRDLTGGLLVQGNESDLQFDLTDDIPDVQGDHWKIIRKIGEESITLLKNTHHSLPIKRSTRRLAVFGSDAGPSLYGLQSCGTDNYCHDRSRPYFWPGTVTTGAGSGTAWAPYVINPLEAITRRARRSYTGHTQVDWVLDDTAYDYINITATRAEQCLVFVSSFAFEGYDRDDLSLWNDGDRLIETVASHCAETVVVIHSPGPVLMERWIDHENVTAVLMAYYPGQESGNAVTNVLFGDVSPSGKLPFTLGKSLEDWPPQGIIDELVDQPNATFPEGNLIDYRYFDANSIEPRFEFGFGLSYTTFEYGKASVKVKHSKDSKALQPTNEKFEGKGGLYDQLYVVSIDIKNTGRRSGSEVAQLYLTFPSSTPSQPPLLLRGFEKLHLKPGQTKTAHFPLRAKDLSVWSVEKQLWEIPEGELVVRVGRSSRDLGEAIELPELS